MARVYKTVAFNPVVKTKGVAATIDLDEIASQMETAINSHVSQGWNYVNYEEVITVVNKGCLGLIFAIGKPKFVTTRILIFYRDTP
jgi:hypothetical protein